MPILNPHQFPLSDVKLLDGPFRDNQQLDLKYMLSLDMDRLLAGYRANADLSAKAAPYGGWESRGLEGHTLGHYLSACSMMYAATEDSRLLKRVQYIVDELNECQKAASDGFLGGMPRGRELFANISRGDFGTHNNFAIQGSWVPWYNEHKLFAGLRDAYLYTNSDLAKEILIRCGDWAIGICKNLSDAQMQQMLTTEYGGMSETLADLYAITGQQKYLDLAKRFWDRPVLDPLSEGKDDLTGKHANTQIPKIIGTARIFELTNEPRMKTTVETFWNAVVNDRSYITGSDSLKEHFFALGLEATKLGHETGETCNVYNMLKLTAHLADWSDSPAPYDFYERALFNHILGSIDPDSGTCTYFQALEPGRFKVYATPEDSFWCCTGTGMENDARYGADIYTHDGDGVLKVNLFISSELSWKATGLKLIQKTDFPLSDTTLLTLKLDKPKQLSLRIRVPAWAERGIDVSGAVTAHAPAGAGYLTLDRTWHDGDKITVHLPMSLNLHRSIDDPTMVAVVDGPIVLAATLGRADYPPSDHTVNPGDDDLLYIPPVPVVVTDSKTLDWLSPVPGKPLHFRTAGVGRPGEFEMSPFYSVHHQRYEVYFRLLSPTEYQASAASH
jgi:hypothetical protein